MFTIFTPKTFYWLKTLSKFVSVQLVVQVLGFASGILLIRTLDKQEYAYFTLANSMQGTMNVLANAGVGSALWAIGGKVWQDPYRFGQLINTAMQIRRYLAAVAVTFVAPILLWMLLENGASFNYAFFLIVGVLIELYFYLGDGVMRIVPRLYSQFNRLQNFDLIFAGSRIILLIGSSLIFFNAAIGIFASTIASGLKNKFLCNSVKNTVKLDVPINQEDKKDIFKLIKLQAPNSIFYCFQGQLTIILISIFGNTENIAEVGALTRLSLIFSIITSLIINIILPSFARLKTAKKFIINYLKVSFVLCIFCVMFLLAIYLYPQSFLFLLGNEYNYLVDEVFWIALLNIVQFISKILWRINSTKGWMEQAWLFIPTIIATQMIALVILDVSNVKGIIMFSIYSMIPACCINFYMTYWGLKRWQFQ